MIQIRNDFPDSFCFRKVEVDRIVLCPSMTSLAQSPIVLYSRTLRC